MIKVMKRVPKRKTTVGWSLPIEIFLMILTETSKEVVLQASCREACEARFLDEVLGEDVTVSLKVITKDGRQPKGDLAQWRRDGRWR